MKKELKSGILSADKSADGRPTVGGVNVIAVSVVKSILMNEAYAGFKALIEVYFCIY